MIAVILSWTSPGSAAVMPVMNAVGLVESTPSDNSIPKDLKIFSLH